ncbi:hypothetical protein AAY473_013981 [Plecturocebus cupreus]
MSSWNLCPGNCRMHRDLVYLFVVTAEAQRGSITTVVGLLPQLGPEMGGRPHLPFPYLPSGLAPPIQKGLTPFQACSWVAPVTEHTMGCMCGEALAPRGWAVRSTVLHRGLRPGPALTGNPFLSGCHMGFCALP